MAEMVSRIDPKVLKVHPRNAEFFDDVDGAEFDRLVESIKDHGVLTPLRVTKDMTIISGHQRVRAAIQAGCSDVPVIFDESDDENDVLMKLIETNFGRMKNDPIKQAKWVKEYETLKGVRQGQGKDQSRRNNFAGASQEDIAKELKNYPTKFVTCHCTGTTAYDIMKDIMGDSLAYVHCGEELVLPDKKK